MQVTEGIRVDSDLLRRCTLNFFTTQIINVESEDIRILRAIIIHFISADRY
jgi:hypothetical protein